MVRPERRLGDVVGVHEDLVVAAAQVKFGEEARTTELVEELVDDRDWKLVLDGLGVEGAVVDAETSRDVLLANEQHWRRERGRARADDPLSEHVGALLLDLVLEQLRVTIGAHCDWGRA